MRAHVLIEGRASAGPRFAHNESLTRQRARRHHFHARKRMIDRGDEHVRMHGERFGAARPAFGRPAHDRKFNIALLHQRDDLFAVVGNLQSNLDAGMVLTKLREQTRQEILGGTDHSHVKWARPQAAKARDQILGIAHGR